MLVVLAMADKLFQTKKASAVMLCASTCSPKSFVDESHVGARKQSED